ncbi:MAG: dodecin domain-containing protein [Chitinivibrionia bacterium]|nr:dodecin domain-containing protein [Chitinivibrionia bacterium]
MAQTYKVIELVGTSKQSYEDAAASAITEASKTIHDMAWFEVIEQRGRVDDGKVVEFQIKLKVAFKLVR